jgi:hypothetical protein
LEEAGKVALEQQRTAAANLVVGFGAMEDVDGVCEE